MADHRRKRVEHGANSRREGQDTIGNRQQTTQTGAQNNGGENRDREDDQYTKDLERSGDRNSSNRKTGS